MYPGSPFGAVPLAGMKAGSIPPEKIGDINHIGIPGTMGFGVGVCPPSKLPSGMTPLPGCTIKGHANYGNYQYADGSIMVWIPKFYYKIGTGSNGLAVNVIDIKGTDTFATTAQANDAGYALHRAFIDGGEEKDGFFVDKYMCSKNSLGTGFVASSIKGGLPISTNSAHNPIADLTACAGNYYYEAINAAHARDGENGEINPNSIFFVCSRFIYSALAMLAMAHGQASSNTANCAWYNSTYNFPKGCNNNALGDTNDGSVTYESDGYSNCGKTGSGSLFAKTTHNGQDCGVADLNGLMWEISLGLTAIASSVGIEAMTRANPCQVTWTGHGLSTGAYVMITGITQAEWTALKDKIYKITVVDANNFTLDGVDTSGFSADYDPATDPGAIHKATFYVAKQATAMKDFTPGNSGATDHWGATGVANMMEEFTPAFETGYPNNGFSQRFGAGGNQVLSEALSGTGWLLAGLGLPKDANGIDTGGTNLFGQDYYYQYLRNELCALSCAYWAYGSYAGVWAMRWNSSRTNSSNDVGLRCACYPG